MATIRTTCPRDCYDSCGMVVRHAENGTFRVRGDAQTINEGALCGKCAIHYNDAKSADGGRILTPLRRSGPKGTLAFEPISWPKALALASERIDAVLRSGHPERLIHSHYDGTRGLLSREFPLRLLNTLGATAVDPSTICHSAAIAGLESVFGQRAFTLDPREIADAEAVVLWGNNPRVSAPHTYKTIRADPARKVIFVNPLKLDSISGTDLHLRLIPGSDAMLCFAVMRLLFDSDRIDQAFLDRWTTGFEELEPVIRALNLDAAIAATGLTRSQIAEFTECLTRRRTVIWIGMGVQRQRHGGNLARSVAMLPVLTGNMFKKGAGLLYLNGLARHGLDKDRIARNSDARACPTIDHGALPGALMDPERAEVFITWNNNIAVSSPDSGRMERALLRDDLFYLQLEKRLTRSSHYADLVLPAADFSESDDLVYSYANLSISAQTKFRDALGESLSNQEIFRRLAATMGLRDPYLHESDETVLDCLLANVGAGMRFGDLKTIGTHMLPRQDGESFAAQLLPNRARITISFSHAAAMGAPPTPLPIAEGPSAEGRFHLVTPGSEWRINSSLTDNPVLRNRQDPIVLIAPTDADDIGLQADDICELSNATGAVLRIARISDVVRPGQVCVNKCEDFGTNSPFGLLNNLVAARSSDLGACVAFHSVYVNLRRLDGGLPIEGKGSAAE